jgi:TetR/AcrR family transcriptional regulator, regulator of mycofactocin system
MLCQYFGVAEPVIRIPGSTVGRRERKKLETRRALQQAALRLFAERGYDETTVEDITEAADVAVRTFFRYFRSKHDVLVGDILQLSAQLEQALYERPPDEEPLPAIRAAVRAVGSTYEADRESLLLQGRLIEAVPELYTANVGAYLCLDHVIARFVAQRTGTDPIRDLYPRLLGGLAAAAMQRTLLVWCQRGGDDDLLDLLDQAFEHLADGLVPPAPGGGGNA